MKHLLPLLLISLIASGFARAQENVAVSPNGEKIFAQARISVAATNTIYIARLAALTTSPDAFNMCEVLRSDDGYNWQRILLDSVSGLESFQSVDICAAGTDTNARLLLATTSVLNGATAVQSFVRLRTLNPVTGAILDTLRQEGMGTGSDHRGYGAVAVVSDWRMPASYSDPYSVSMAFTKAAPNGMDSVIVYTDNDGGALLYRRSIYGTDKEIRSLSAAVGSNWQNWWPLLGVTWDEFVDTAVEYGDMRVALLDADNGELSGNDGIYTSSPVGTDDDVARRPVIAISQKNVSEDDGIGGQDFRIMMSWEMDHKGSSIRYRSVDSFINGVPQFDYYWSEPEPFEDTEATYTPHLAYDPTGERFYVTYYDALEESIPMGYQALNTPPLSVLTSVTEDYRVANTPILPPASSMPRVGVGNTSDAVYTAWNAQDTTFFNAQEVSTSVQGALAAPPIRISTFPNPTNGVATLAFRAPQAGTLHVEVLAMQGRVLMTTAQTITTGDNQLRLDLSALPGGAYLLRLSGAVAGFAKVVVSH